MQSSTADFYSILGVSRHANVQEIRQAFRAMARRYHPDSNPQENTIDQFQQINRAYEVLRNPDLRRSYDLYGFDGIGTSAASDAEEMEQRSSRQGSRAQHFGYQRYEDFMTVDNTNHVYQSGPNWASNRQQRPTKQPYQPREPFHGDSNVYVEGIGMGHTSDTFFGRTRGSDFNGRQNGEPRRGGSYVPVDNPDVGATSHSFFGDVDVNGKPRGARVKRSTQPADMKATPNNFFMDIDEQPKPSGANTKRTAASAPRAAHSNDFFAQNHVSENNPSSNNIGNSRDVFQNGQFKVSEPDSQKSFFRNMNAVTDKPSGRRYAPNNQPKPGFSHRIRHPDARPSPRTTTYSSQQKSSARRNAAAKNRPPVSNPRSVSKPSPYVGGGAKRQVGVRNENRSTVFQPNTGGPPKGRVSIGGDIQVELNVASSTVVHGGLEHVLVTRLEPCDACGGNGGMATTSTCSKCGSQGLKRKKEEVKVIVPAGSADGSMIRLEGEGDAGANGGPPGDLYVFLRVSQQEGERAPEAEANSAEETTKTKGEVPDDTLNAEEQALLAKLRDLLEIKQQNDMKGLRP